MLCGKEQYMIDTLFYRATVRQRITSGPIGPYIEALAKTLHEHGYRPDTIRRSLSASDKFGRWLTAHAVPLEDVTQATVTQYVQEVGRRAKAVQGLSLVVRFLCQHGLALLPEPPCPPTAQEEWLGHYEHYLRNVRGLADNTCDIYLRLARRFMVACFPRDRVDWQVVTAQQVVDFIRQEAARRRGFGRKEPSVAIRALLRFVVFRGERAPGLEGAVPTPCQWTHAALPTQLTAAEVEHVLTTSRGDSSGALRNYAILLLLARLGIRAREVARLRLEDIDWQTGQLMIRPGKTHQARVLPLSQEVGNALVAYVTKARPESTSRGLFLRLHPPFRPFVRACGVSRLVRRALEHAGIPARPRMGAHLFRHTIASHLVQKGASFKAVADLLGHRSLQTTGIYAKLDLAALTGVALPWTGGAQ
jgi:site-specific recombinase XerD